MDDAKVSKHAQALSVLGAAKGGLARAAALSSEERSQQARRAAEARWASAGIAVHPPRETHPGVLKIRDKEIACGVLDNGIRVLSTRGVTRALGGKKTGAGRPGGSGAPQLPPFLGSESLKPFISEQLMVRLISPVQYRPQHGGRTAFGYEADLLPEICEALIEADKAGALKSNQKHLADAAYILIRAFAKLGITALVDEATGYQEIRDRLALQKILDKYILQELAGWAKRFPDEFFEELFRLRGWQYKPLTVAKPSYVGHLINDLVYMRLAPGVLDELRRLTPRNEKGKLLNKLHQWLTEDVGHTALQKHLAGVVYLMKAHDDWSKFYRAINKVAPKFGHNLELDLPGDD